MEFAGSGTIAEGYGRWIRVGVVDETVTRCDIRRSTVPGRISVRLAMHGTPAAPVAGQQSSVSPVSGNLVGECQAAHGERGGVSSEVVADLLSTICGHLI